MFRVFLFILLQVLPLSFSFPLSNLEKDYAEARRADACQKWLFSHKQQLLQQISSLAECESRRNLCRSRPNAVHTLTSCDGDCSTEKKIVRQVDAACRFVSGCSSLNYLKEKLAELEERTCPGHGRSEETRNALYSAAEDRREKLGIRKVDYRQTTLEPEDAPADRAIIVLHGVGQSANDFEDLAKQLQIALPRTRIIMPQANTGYVTFFNSTMPSWFNILNNDLDGVQDEEGVISAANNVEVLARVQNEVYGISRERIVVAGISQGGALGLTVFLRHEIGGCVSLSGFLPISERYPEELGEGSGSVLMIHGTKDDLVPIRAARLSRDKIREVGRGVEYKEYEGEGHELDGVRWQVGFRVLEFVRDILELESIFGFRR